MLRLPQEPEDKPFKPFGEKVIKIDPFAAVARTKPFTDYRPINGRPGWSEDGFGHLQVDGYKAPECRYLSDDVYLADLLRYARAFSLPLCRDC